MRQQILTALDPRHALGAFAVLGALALGLHATPASADELVWRQASVRTEQQGLNYVRRGVAMFGGTEPATLTFRGVTRPPTGFTGRMEMRFDDGSGFAFEAEGSVEMAEGRPVSLRMRGPIVGGSGRYAGMEGTVEMEGRVGLDPTASGHFGDIFATGRATYTLKR